MSERPVAGPSSAAPGREAGASRAGERAARPADWRVGSGGRAVVPGLVQVQVVNYRRADLTYLNLKLRPTLLKMKPGTRIVSNSFNMGDWEPDAVADLPEGSCDNSWCTALFWVVPANVEGTHKVAQGELTLKQTFQKVTGTLKGADGKTINVDGKVMGEELQLTAAGKPLRGKVNGKRIELS
jgi:hypothetical protein